jgi:hypothetical protein
LKEKHRDPTELRAQTTPDNTGVRGRNLNRIDEVTRVTGVVPNQRENATVCPLEFQNAQTFIALTAWVRPKADASPQAGATQAKVSEPAIHRVIQFAFIVATEAVYSVMLDRRYQRSDPGRHEPYIVEVSHTQPWHRRCGHWRVVSMRCAQEELTAVAGNVEGFQQLLSQYLTWIKQIGAGNYHSRIDTLEDEYIRLETVRDALERCPAVIQTAEHRRPLRRNIHGSGRDCQVAIHKGSTKLFIARSHALAWY